MNIYEALEKLDKDYTYDEELNPVFYTLEYQDYEWTLQIFNEDCEVTAEYRNRELKKLLEDFYKTEIESYWTELYDIERVKFEVVLDKYNGSYINGEIWRNSYSDDVLGDIEIKIENMKDLIKALESIEREVDNAIDSCECSRDPMGFYGLSTRDFL